VDQILAAIDDINSNYNKHCQAARQIAQDHFEARKVAAKMLADIGL
jgi:hypothetical protein